MYQPKWGTDPQKLQKVVALAQARPEVYTQLAQRIAAALKASGLQAQAAQVLPQAIGILQARAARNPRDASAHEDLAYLLRNSKQYAQAVTHFQAWMRLEPRNAVPVHNLANMYLNRMNDADKAEPLYLKAMKMLPRDPHAPGALGALYKDFKRDYVKAEQMYRESLRRDPNYAYSLSGLANIYFFVKGDPQKAEQLFQQAIVSDPSNGRNYADYAWVLMQQGRRDEAIAQGRKAIALGEDDHPVLSQLGLS
jgi:Flp pilus assembly protein TadD